MVLRAVLLLALLCPALLAAAEGPAPPPRILVVMSYHLGMPWEDGVAAGLAGALHGRAELVHQYLDVKRFPGQAREAAQLATLRDLVAVSRPALVLAVDDYAWQLVQQHRTEIIPGLPVVFAGVNWWPGGLAPPATTGVVEGSDPAGSVALAFRLHPAARRLVVVNDITETGLANRKLLDAVLPAVTAGREILWLGAGTFSETERALAALRPDGDVVLVMSWNLDAAGAVRSYDQAAERIRAVCPAPVYAAWDLYHDKGLVGGLLLDARTHGERAGVLAARVLAGERPEDLPVDTRPSVRLELDQRELDRFRVDPALVPAEALVLHRPDSFWRLHGATVLVAALVILLQAATIAGLLVAMRRRRRAEAERRAVEMRMQRSQRMDAVGQLAAGVAHDFNNVLTAILGHADLLAMRLDGRPDLRSSVEVIAGAAQRAAGTVRNLLVFARGTGSGVAGACEANTVLREVVALLEHSIDRRIAVTTRLDPEAGQVGISAAELQQVVVNLALNARDAMPQGGRLSIATSRFAVAPGQEAASGLAAGSYVEIAIADSGCGIPAAHLERIFDPFFTTKELGKGTGLGLAVVHGAVERARGAIHVACPAAGGTVFRVQLPCVARAPSVVLAGPQPLAGRRVLLVDDEQVVLQVMRRLLESCGCRVEVFGDPCQVGTWFAERSGEVDVAVLDGNMPGMTGWQLAAQLREARPDLPIIALTGAATPEAVQAWRTAGVSRVLTKPISRDQLQQALAELPAGSG